MNRESLYHKTVDILVQAYFNDTLEHGNPCGCAVGNIVASNCGIKYIKNNENQVTYEGALWPQWFGLIQHAFAPNKKEMKRQIKSTGYTNDEIIEIEHAFEHANRSRSKDEYMFNGLMAVIETLDEIHENKDSEISQTSKSKFQKQLA